MEPGIYAGLIYVVLHIIKKAVKLILSPLSRHSKKPPWYHGGKNDTWRGFFYG